LCFLTPRLINCFLSLFNKFVYDESEIFPQELPVFFFVPYIGTLEPWNNVSRILSKDIF
jgi:hypothetical protein